MITALVLFATFLGGWFLWTFVEYVLHRFAFHLMKGRGVGSRAHLDHHVHSSWRFDPLILWAWLGVVLLGWGLGSAAAALVSPGVGWALGAGWIGGYFFYEWHHRASHLRGPRNDWEAWVRKSHFHHHFGHPLHNQGVTIPLWDKVFGTEDRPDVVRVPRRLALPWLLDDDGEIRVEYADDYVLIGSATATDARQAGIDRARAFANLEPAP